MIKREEYLKAKEIVDTYESTNKPKRIIPNVPKEDREKVNIGFDFPKFPLCRVIRDGCCNFCSNCKSTASRKGFLGIFGEMLCHNDSCINSKPKFL
jgi:hypothetical protein